MDVMKIYSKGFIRVLLFCYSILLLLSCNKKSMVIDDWKIFAETLKDSVSYYNDDDWKRIELLFRKKQKEIDRYEFTRAEFDSLYVNVETCQRYINAHKLNRGYVRKIVCQISNTGYTEVHEKPHVDSKVIGYLVNETAEYLGIDSSLEWYKVRTNGVQGYVSRSHTIIYGANPLGTDLVYYVVVGGWFNKWDAIKKQAKGPGLYVSPLFSTVNSEGRLVYRLCCYCSHSKEKADSVANIVRNTGTHVKRFDTANVWKNVGQAKCVYQPLDSKNFPIVVIPE